MSMQAQMPDGELPGIVYYPNGTQVQYIHNSTHADYTHMGTALTRAKEALQAGDSPIGAVLVTPNEVYSDQTREFRDDDLQGHAEMRVYQQARSEVGRYLGACMLYTTAEPCLGCAYLLDKGQIGTLFVGASREDAPEFFRRRNTLHSIWSDSRRTLTVIRGLRKVEAAELLNADSKQH